MNRLEICNKVWLLCNMQGSELTSTSPTIQEQKKVVAWVDAEWELIESRRDWSWRWKECYFDTQGTERDYDGDGASVLRWLDAFKAYDTSKTVAEEFRIARVSHQFMRHRDLDHGDRTAGPPTMLAVKPDNTLRLAVEPDATYRITGEYIQKPVAMAADADEPGMPAHLHMLIVYQAMKAYAADEDAPEVANRAAAGATPLWRELESQCLPEVGIGPNPIA